MADESAPPKAGLKKDAPLFRQIADKLRSAIRDGAYAPGARLPGEKALGEQYGTSIATTRKALALLQRQRLIDIKRGVGAYVRDWKPILRDANRRLSAEQWGSGKPIWEVDVGNQVPVPELSISRTDAVPRYVADAIGAEYYLVRDRCFAVDGRPVQLAASYLDADLVAGTAIEQKNSGEGGTYARLAELGHKPAWFREQVVSRLPDEAEAKRLKIGVDEPVSEIVRQAMTEEGRIVEVNVMVLVGDAYVLQYVFPS